MNDITKKRNILVVDDNISMVRALKKFLNNKGYNVFTAKNQKETFNILQKQNIDLIILDLFLEDEKGHIILNEVKQNYPDIEVIIISGRAKISDAVEIVKEGAFDFLEKPFKPNILLNKIRNAFKHHYLNIKFKYLDKKFNDINQLKEYNESVINNMPIGLLTVDNHDNINICNPYIKKLLNIDDYEILDKNINTFFQKTFKDNQKISELYIELKKNNISFSTILLNQKINKHYNNGNITNKHLRVFGSKFSKGIIIFVSDITESYNLKQEIVQNEKLSRIGQFTASITHGLGNNMANIISNASAVYEDSEELNNHVNNLLKNFMNELDEEKIDMFKKIKKITDRIIDFSARLLKRANEMDMNLKSLLNFSRVQKEVKTSANINSLLEDAISIAKGYGYNEIRFTKKLSNNLPEIKVNTFQIRDMFLDIILNGIHACGKKGEIIYSTLFNKDNNTIIVSISDTGKGISPEIQDKIFNAFFTTKSNGTGLGLVNVKSTVKLHNGKIYFKTQKDIGTTFFIEFPVR